MRLAIVGTRHVPNPEYARDLIDMALGEFGPETVITGGAEGIDTMAEEMAQVQGIEVEVLLPENQRWEPRGFKARNQLIARECDVLVSIRSAQATSYGSGWTADEAERLGKQVFRWGMP